MSDVSGIRAGKAYVELGVKDNTAQGLNESRQKIQKYTQDLKSLQAKIDTAQAAGQSGKVASLQKVQADLQGRLSAVKSSFSERSDTLAQAAAGRASLMERLSAFKADDEDIGGGGKPIKLRKLAKLTGKTVAQAGISSVGGELGFAAGLLEMGGPAAAVLAPLAVLGAGFKAASDIVNDAKEHMKELTAEMEKAAEAHMAARRIYAPQVEKGGDKVREAMDAARKQLNEINNRDTDKTGVWNSMWSGEYGLGNWFGLNKLWGTNTNSTGYEETQKAEGQKKMDLQRAQDDLKKLQERAQLEDRIFEARKRYNLQVEVSNAKIAAMLDGPAKRWAELEQRQATEKYNAEQENRLVAGSVDMGKLAQRHGYERQALMNLDQQEKIKDFNAATESFITASTEEGFNRQIALLRAKHAAELKEYQDAGRDTTNLVVRQNNELVAAHKDRNKKVDDIKRGFQRSFEIATGKTTSQEWEWKDIEKTLKELGVLDKEIDKIKSKWQEASKAQVLKPITDQIYESDLSIKVLLRQMTEAQAAVEKYKHDNPAAKDVKEVGQIGAKMEAREAAQAARQIKETLNPGLLLEDYKKVLDKALQLKYINKDEYNAALWSKTAETMKYGAIGTFNPNSFRSFLGGTDSIQQRIAKATEQTAKNTTNMQPVFRGG